MKENKAIQLVVVKVLPAHSDTTATYDTKKMFTQLQIMSAKQITSTSKIIRLLNKLAVYYNIGIFQHSTQIYHKNILNFS